VLALRVPESVVPCLKHVLSEKEFKKNLHCYLWPVHLIQERQALYSDMVYNQDNGYINLHSIYDLKEVVGGSKPVIRTLKNAGIIYCKKSKAGGESYYTKQYSESGEDSETKSYAIDERYHFDNLIEHHVINRKFIERASKHKSKREYKPKTKVERYLKKAFKDFQLDSYAESYCELKRAITSLREAINRYGTCDHKKLSKHHPEIIGRIESNGHTVSQVISELECIPSYKQGRYHTDLLQISQFTSGEIFFTRAENGRRVFTTANLMPRDLRRFLKHKDGKTLYEADVRNCQPLMLCGLLRERFGNKWQADMLLYKRLCSSGKFYEYMHNVIEEVELNAMSEDARIKFKEQLFGKVFYCKVSTSSMRTNREARGFEPQFPTVYKFINGYKNKFGYKALAIKMQEVESDLMIDSVCVNLMNAKAPTLSIHDGLIVTEDDAPYTKDVMLQAFDKKQGLQPEIALKPVKPHDIALYKRFDYLADVVTKSI
jgi:hypothetical protein